MAYHIKNGGFCSLSSDIYNDIVLDDKTILEKDNIITNKFSNLGVVHPNILNLEFMFDDDDNEDFVINRYMGFYVSEAELTKFRINENNENNDISSDKIEIKEFIKNGADIKFNDFKK